MNRRSEGVAKELQDVTDAQDQLKRDREQAQLEIEDAHKQAAEIVANSAKQAQDQAQRILDEAHNDAELTLKQAKTEADFMRRNARDEMRDEVASLSVQLAERILQREVRQDDHGNRFFPPKKDANCRKLFDRCAEPDVESGTRACGVAMQQL